jgi:uncharacterized protein (DUF305 family)
MSLKVSHVKAFQLGVAALALGLLMPAVHAQTSPDTTMKPMPADVAKPAPAGSTMDMKSMDMKGMDMKKMMMGMNEKMSAMKPSGNPDVDFASMMKVHHQGAIDMAEAELRDGKDTQMRRMANDIIRTQKKEISQLDKFLQKSGATAMPMNK